MDDSYTEETVVLLHGIFRTSRHMKKLENCLHDNGYDVFNLDYPSTKFDLAELTSLIINRIRQQIADDKVMHFVGYSMGGLLVRTLLNQYRPQKLGRVIQLAPPNHGSEVADFISGFWLYKMLYGPAGQQLGMDQTNIQHLFGTIDYDLGIIAGNFSIDPISSLIIRGADDGKVSVLSTKLQGMSEHIVVNASHTFFPSNKRVQHETLHFIKKGHFST